ncbi:MAG: permease-like cell division protein FtsX [Candidatus Peregrinibacteria bacterium]|nr:permease-like cell division protein FtsX [Candidatus Peregrinibacteria bacterium]
MKQIPSSLNLIKRGFSLAVSNVWRNKFLSVAVIFVIAVILLIFNTILLVNFISQDALSDLNKKIDIVAYLKESTSYEQVISITNDLKNIEGVESATYFSKEDALAQINKLHPDISGAFEKYNLGNPLPASINIKTIHPKYYKTVTEFLSQEKYSTYLSNFEANSSENASLITSAAQNLVKITNFAGQIIFWLIAIFIVGGALIILNAIQITIFNRKKEIEVMKLVGASYSFIRLPFIIESIIYGLLAIVLSLGMFALITQKIDISSYGISMTFQNSEIIKIIIGEILATIALSVTSSLIAVHEYLNQ